MAPISAAFRHLSVALTTLILTGVSLSKVRGQQHTEGPLTCESHLVAQHFCFLPSETTYSKDGNKCHQSDTRVTEPPGLKTSLLKPDRTVKNSPSCGSGSGSAPSRGQSWCDSASGGTAPRKRLIHS